MAAVQRRTPVASLFPGLDRVWHRKQANENVGSTPSPFFLAIVYKRDVNPDHFAAHARGRLGGRLPMSLDDPRIQTAKTLHANKNMPVVDICKTLQISRPTLYRWLALKSAVGAN